jgi:hypothetical protein
MAGITITLPTSQAEIPQVLEDLRAQLAAKNAEANALRGAIQSVQAMCKHPSTRSGRDYDGGGWTKCNTCGREL